jgi:hypothetical protein
MARNDLPTADTEEKLAAYIGQFYYDPYGFVMAVFPWGVPGTSLEHKKGPEPWQEKLLKAIGQHCIDNYWRKMRGEDMHAWRSAIASGHGIGKSATVAWLNYWLMSTRINGRGVVTANTGNQLETKTWPELAKWHAMAINKHWFQWTSTSFYFKAYPEEQRKNYMINALTVSEENTEAFAGLHNEGSAVWAIFDEASGIEGRVWEVVEGALTDGEPFFFAFGNPTRADGEFYECFHKHKDLYWKLHVDSREVSHTNKHHLETIIKKYGADSDAAKVRVYGQFPIMSYNGYITVQAVTDAAERDLYPDTGAALIMAVDVARFGDDSTVIRFRQGNDARSIAKHTLHGKDGIEVAKVVGELADRYRPDAIVIESVGPGVSVIDQLKVMRYNVIAVHPGARAINEEMVYGNQRMLWWSEMRDWLMDGGCIPDDPDLFRDLTSIQYRYDNSEARMFMEPKKDMKSRGLPSPDDGDSLALTFAVKIARRDMSHLRREMGAMSQTEYDELAI